MLAAVAARLWPRDLAATTSSTPTTLQRPEPEPAHGCHWLVKGFLDRVAYLGRDSLMSGYPVAVTFSTSPAADFTGSNEVARSTSWGTPICERRADLLASLHTAAFARPRPGVFGHDGSHRRLRQRLEGYFEPAGFNMWNAAITKTIRVHETHRFQFTAEFFNWPNHTQFRPRDTNATFDANGNQINLAFGEYISGLGARNIQLGLRYDFERINKNRKF